MLREVKNKHFGPRIIPFQLTTTASGVTLDSGAGDFTATRTAAGTGVLTCREGFYRNGLILMGQQTTAGGYGVYNSTSGENDAFAYSILNASGTAVEGTLEGFCFGWDSPDLSLTKAQNVTSTRNYPIICWGKITGSSGAVAIGSGAFTCTRTAAGTYTIGFDRLFGTTPQIVVTGVSTGAATTARITSKTGAGCVVTMAPQTGTPTDADFYIVMMGQRSRNDGGKARQIIQNSQRKPRIIACEVTNSGGTWSLSIGGATGGTDFTTLTDNGAGVFSVTIAEPFRREPAIVACSTTQRVQVHSYSNNVIRILTKNSGGTNADTNGVTHLFVIGSDDPSEY